MGFSINPIFVPIQSKMAEIMLCFANVIFYYLFKEIRHLENRHDVIFSAECGPIWIKFRRLVQNDMSTAIIWSKSKPDVEFQYGGRLGEFNGMSSEIQLPQCRVLPLGEFNTMFSELRVTLQGAATGQIQCHVISEPRVTLQGAVTWRNQCHERATLQGVRIPSTILKIFFFAIFYFILFLMQFGL